MEVRTRTNRTRPGRWTFIGCVCLISVGMLSFNAYANFTATQSYNHSVSTGTMAITLANETSATINYNLSGSNLAPGDNTQRALLLTFAGTVSASSMTLSAADSTTTTLDDGTPNGLTIKVESCSQKWDETVSGSIPIYACTGSITTVLASQTLASLISTPAANLTTSLNLGGANHLKIIWTLPAAADNSFQNLSDTIAVTFTSNQRSGTDR